MAAPEPAAALATVFLLGVALGLTACALTCLPFIGSYVFGRAQGFRAGLADAALFLCGRLLAYTALGALAGALGAWFVRGLAAGHGNLALGLAALLAAALLVAGGQAGAHGACGRLRAGALPPLLLGFALTLIPCAPLATLLAAAAGGGSAAQGALLGLAFGAGALVTPMLVLIPLTAGVGARLRLEQPWLAGLLRHGAAAVLALLGWRRLAAADEVLAAVALTATAAGALLPALRRRRRALPRPMHISFPAHSVK